MNREGRTAFRGVVGGVNGQRLKKQDVIRLRAWGN